MRLLRGVVGFGQGFRDDELRQVDLVLQEVRDDLLRVIFGALDIALDEHLAQASVDHGHDEPAVVSSNGLPSNGPVRRLKATDESTAKDKTYLDTFRVHLVVLLRLGPVQSSVSLLADEEVREVNLLELELDRLDELGRDVLSRIRAFLYRSVVSGLSKTTSLTRSRLTESHGSFEIWATEADHDGISVAVDDPRVIVVAVGGVVSSFDLL